MLCCVCGSFVARRPSSFVLITARHTYIVSFALMCDGFIIIKVACWLRRHEFSRKGLLFHLPDACVIAADCSCFQPFKLIGQRKKFCLPVILRKLHAQPCWLGCTYKVEKYCMKCWHTCNRIKQMSILKNADNVYRDLHYYFYCIKTILITNYNI